MMAETKHTKAFYNTEIPSDWEIIPLGEVFKLTSGKTKPNDLFDEPFDENIYPVFGGNGIMGFASEFNSEGENILIGRVGEYCGITRFVNEKCWITDNALYSKEFLKDVDAKYFAYKLQLEDLSRLRNKGGQPLISQGPIGIHKICLPKSLPEQKAIAQVLSTADAAIHTTEKLIAQKELRKKWLMQQLLSGKKRLKGFSGEWKEFRFEKLLKVVKRPVKWDDNELYKLISVRRRSGGIFFREALYGHQIKVKDLRDAEVGDFLFSKMQIVHGASALVTKEFEGAKISGSYISTVAKDSKLLNMEFFNWYSQLPYFYHQALISSYGVHIEKMTFDFDTFLQLEMKLPCIEEQTAIAQVLRAADTEISLLKAKAEKLREQKKGLMQVLLTGRVRLKINDNIK